MDIEVDYNPTPGDHYFISVGLNDKEAISFDKTTKGHRIMKQVLIEKLTLEDAVKKYGPVVGGWEVICLKDGKFERKYRAEWIDLDKWDVVNGENWETEWVKPLDDEADAKLLEYSRLISDNYQNLDDYAKEMAEFETFIQEELNKLK